MSKISPSSSSTPSAEDEPPAKRGWWQISSASMWSFEANSLNHFLLLWLLAVFSLLALVIGLLWLEPLMIGLASLLSAYYLSEMAREIWFLFKVWKENRNDRS